MNISYKAGDPKALSRMIQKAQEINRRSVQVGVFDGDHAWLAGIHEYGCTITPKNGGYLTVPLTKAAASNQAKNFVGTLFTHPKAEISL